MRKDLIAWWTAEISEYAPIGHVLRKHLSDRWTRFHSLPESKRYAETDDEHNEIVRRHLSIANALFAVGEPIYIYRSDGYEQKLKGKQKHKLTGHQLREHMHILPTGLSRKEDECEHYNVRALATSWTPSFFNTLTREVAKYQETGIALVSPATKNIYCPYDGGMDVFPHSLHPGSLEAKFSSWMSAQAGKL